MNEEQKNFEDGIEDPTREAHWPKVLFYTYLQMLMFYGIFLTFTQAYLSTAVYSILLITLGVIGVTAGAHRLWTHNSYMASTSLKIFLMLCHTLVGQGSIYEWVLYHRLHHKHFGTKQDPYNSSKGFIYAHFMCLVQKPIAEQEELITEIDMGDLEQDSVVMFQKKYYWLLYPLVVALIPVYIPYRFWHESFVCAACVAGWMRYGIGLHCAWLIHSAATVLGLQKGEKYPSDTNMVFLVDKTYWLQYHYLTPWDYQCSEYGKYGNDFTSAFIRVCAALDLATNLRTLDSNSVKNALYLSVETKEPITDCLLKIEANGTLPKNHFLEPKKYY